MYSELIISFNEINAEYEVIIKDYSIYPDPQQMLNTDIISGNSPDLIDVAGFSGEIIKRGTMKDLMRYIKADKSIKKSDFLAGPLSAMMTEDGELLSIAPFFYVCTLLCREGTVETGNYNGVISALEKLGPPEDAFAGTFSRDSFLSLAFCCGGADKYSRDEVAAIIEYASKLPLEENNSREIENLQNGKQRFMRITLGAPGHLFSTAIEDFACSGLDDLTVLGMPFYDGTGVVIPAVYFAIPANAANADGAWAFLQNLLYIFDNKNTHYSYEDLNEYPLMQPIYKASKEAVIKSVEKGLRQELMIDGKTVEYIYKTKDITDSYKFSDKILDGLSGVCDEDAKVYEIVTDACGAYFAGQKSLDATVDEIMSRFNIYFSEKK